MKKRIISVFVIIAIMLSMTNIVFSQEFYEKDIFIGEKSSYVKDNLIFIRKDGAEILIEYCKIWIESYSGLYIMSIEGVDSDNIFDDELLIGLLTTGVIPNDVKILFFGRYTQISDYSHLSVLSALDTLHFQRSKIGDLSSLKNLPYLQNLEMYECKINDIFNLKELNNLKHLSFRGNNINDYTPLKSLTNLESLEISDDSINFFINDVLEILQYLIGMENEINCCIVTRSIYLLTEESKATGEPTIFDAIYILEKLVGM